LPYEQWSFLATNCWIKLLWRFVDFSKIKLMPFTLTLPSIQCIVYGYIMEMVPQAHLPKAMVLAINHCHNVHNALYWSDISNGWGNWISPSMLSPPSRPPRSSWVWPPEHPTNADLAIWVAFLNNSPCTILGLLVSSPGQWVLPPHWLDVILSEETSLMAFHLWHDAYCISFWLLPLACIG